jgi:hypothetical protein
LGEIYQRGVGVLISESEKYYQNSQILLDISVGF